MSVAVVIDDTVLSRLPWQAQKWQVYYLLEVVSVENGFASYLKDLVVKESRCGGVDKEEI